MPATVDGGFGVAGSISKAQALASLARLDAGFRDTPGAAEPIGSGRAPIEAIHEWQTRIGADDMSPNQLPGLYGHMAGLVSHNPRLARQLLDERRELLAGAGYGNPRWFGEPRTLPPGEG